MIKTIFKILHQVEERLKHFTSGKIIKYCYLKKVILKFYLMEDNSMDSIYTVLWSIDVLNIHGNFRFYGGRSMYIIRLTEEGCVYTFMLCIFCFFWFFLTLSNIESCTYIPWILTKSFQRRRTNQRFLLTVYIRVISFSYYTKYIYYLSTNGPLTVH